MNAWRRWGSLAVTLLVLNISLTFSNVWPTPFIRWAGDVSVELAALVLILAVVGRGFGRLPRGAINSIVVFWMLLVLGRYMEVTADALYGRPLNLYWDVRYVPDVASMLARAAPVWFVVLVVAAAALLLVLLYVVLRRALGRLFEAAVAPPERRVLAAIALLFVLVFTGQQLTAPDGRPYFAMPAMQTYVRQVQLVARALMGANSIAPSPPMASDLAYVQGADVLLLFMESYGAVSWERPDIVDRLKDSRAQLEAAIGETGRQAVSAYVESPTFGGSSWLAHLSLLSGVKVADPDTNALLMTQNRDTLVSVFARGGYRTLAVMPGLWFPWPEGAFYGFDEIYRAGQLDYRGPPFGWWAIPDQFTLARLDALEVSRPLRAPLFVFFPTVSTHTPFVPAPPYQPDWDRVLTDQPFGAAELEQAYDQWADWSNLGPSYADALAYAYLTAAGYLRLRANHDLIVILIGDHQPPAFVSGEGATWNVPIHVIASRSEVLDRLLARGFQGGITPRPAAVQPMHELLLVLLDAFGNGQTPALVTAR